MLAEAQSTPQMDMLLPKPPMTKIKTKLENIMMSDCFVTL
jgi:hypothetical protein